MIFHSPFVVLIHYQNFQVSKLISYPDLLTLKKWTSGKVWFDHVLCHECDKLNCVHIGRRRFQLNSPYNCCTNWSCWFLFKSLYVIKRRAIQVCYEKKETREMSLFGHEFQSHDANVWISKINLHYNCTMNSARIMVK